MGGVRRVCYSHGAKGEARPRSMDVVEKGVAQDNQWRSGRRELQGGYVNKETT